MTVASNTPYDQYLASNGQTVFNYTFEIVEDTDLLVYQTPNGDPPNDVTQVLVFNVDYTVTGAGNENGGTVVLNSGTALNDVITIKQNIPVQRDTSFTPGGVLRAQDLNTEFDNQTLIQQVTRFNEESRTIRYWDSEILIPFTDTIIPKLAAQQVWRMSEDGTEIEAFTIDTTPVPSNSYFLTYGTDPSLENEQNIALIGNGILKNTVSGGFATVSIAVNGVDYWKPGDILTLPGLPTNPNDAASKEYVDTFAGGFSLVLPVEAATTGNFTSTYNNGAGGIGATLTATSNGAASIDGVSLSLFDRVLFKNQTNTFENGIYEVSQVGDGSNPAVYTRTADFDTPAEIIPGILVPVTGGTVNINSLWLQTSTVTTIGTDPIVFVQYGIVASDIVTISGNQTITGDKEFTGVVEVPTPVSGTEAANKDYVDGAAGFPSGTKMLFVQTSAPTGWTKDTTAALNNTALRVVTGAASSGGTVDFTTAFASQAVAGTNAGFTLTNSEIPSHNHSFSGQSAVPNLQTGVTPVALQNNNVNTTGSTGGGGSHTHTFTGTAINLAVKYNDVIIASKD